MAAKRWRARSAQERAQVRRSAARNAKLFKALAEGKSITLACLAAGYCRRSVFNWKTNDAEFAEAFRDAMEAGADLLEDEALRRASRGFLEPVYQQGSRVGSIRRYSDRLLIFLLNGKRPEKYRNRISAELTGRGGIALAPAVVILPANGRESPPTLSEVAADGEN